MDNNGKNNQAEIFKVCPNNPGILVSKYGTMKNSVTGEVLEQILSEKGYWTVKNPLIIFKNPREFEYVHRLVALTYVPGYSHICWICHHKDNNPCNNYYENLIWSSLETHNKLHRYYSMRMSA